MSPTKASAAVIAAGIHAILGSLFWIFCLLLGVLGLSLAPAQKELPGISRAGLSVFLLIFLAVAVFGIFTGVGLIRLRNWARISALAWAAITAVFSAFLLIAILVIPFPPVPDTPGVSVGTIKAVMAIFYGIPILIGVWWLILFNQLSTKAQFIGNSAPKLIQTSPLPRCPLPVAIIAGIMLFSVLGMFAMPLLRMPVFMILFGHRMRGEFGNFLFASTTVLYLAAAIGLLRLKRWSYPLSLGLYGFWTLSGVVTFLSPNYKQILQETFSEMHVPESSAMSLQFISSPAFALFSLIPTLMIVGILLYYRTRFWAASEPTTPST
jgi:hypothetical protein